MFNLWRIVDEKGFKEYLTNKEEIKDPSCWIKPEP